VREIRALTVKQPWAHMIAYGGKIIENRVWETYYRGLLAIHAGSGWDRNAEASPLVREAWRAWASNAANPMVSATPLGRKNPGITFGAIIAIADLSGCHKARGAECPCSPWGQPDQWHLELSSVHPLAKPVPCRGWLKLWRLPPEVTAAVRGQLA